MSKIELNFETLLKNIISTVYEGILKLGITKGESFGLYYEPDLLNYLLGAEAPDRKEMLPLLKEFAEYAKEQQIPVSVSGEGSRFRFLVAPEGVLYITEHASSSDFLKNLISLVNTQVFGLNQVDEVFRNSGYEYHCREIDNPEFEYVFSFADKSFDPYLYCFHFDKGHSHYHRLLEYSYLKLFGQP